MKGLIALFIAGVVVIVAMAIAIPWYYTTQHQRWNVHCTQQLGGHVREVGRNGAICLSADDRIIDTR